MPNNRNRNRNRNRNKRNRNQNQNQNQNQQQEQREEDTQPEATSSSIDDNGNSGSVSNGSATDANSSENSHNVAVDPQLEVREEPPKEAAATEGEGEDKEKSTINADQNETEAEQPPTSSEPTEMGAKNSKQQSEKSGKRSSNETEQRVEQAPLKAPGSPRQAKVIVHRIVREVDEQQQQQQQQSNTSPELKDEEVKVPEEKEVVAAAPQPLQRSTKVIIHQIRVERDVEQAPKGKPTFEEISTTTPAPPAALSLSTDGTGGTLSPPPRYLVESPKNVSGAGAVGHFGHFARDMQIQELELELSSDCSSGEFNVLQSPLVCEVDSETEAAAPLDLQPSSRAEQQEQLRQKRAQKRNALESHFLPQLMNPRYLDSILEENSDLAGVGLAGGLHRSSSSGNDQAGMRLHPKLTETFPKSQLDFSRRHKRREEPVALMLETKLIEEASDLESCTRLQSALSPQSEDAELVYLSSSASSSMSDLMELELEQAAALAERALVDLDTDASKLFRRPDDEMSSTTTTDAATSSNETETEGEPEMETGTETETDTESRESTPVNRGEGLASAGSSLSSLLSAATPTPPTSAEQPQPQLPRAEDTFVSFDSIREQPPVRGSIGSIGAASTLSATREEFVRNMDKVRELIEMTRREEEQQQGEPQQTSIGNGVPAPEQFKPRSPSPSPSPPPIPPPPAGLQHYNPNSPTIHTVSLPPLLLSRQESAESHCSDSTQHSQCTAINLASPPPCFASSPPPQTQQQQQQQPPTPPLRQQPQHAPQFPVPKSTPASTCTHPALPPAQQQQQLESEISVADDEPKAEAESDPIKKLRLLCTETLASMPYGEQVLEELASVAQDIAEPGAHEHPQEPAAAATMPYPLPAMPHIRELQLSTSTSRHESKSSSSSTSAWLGMPTQADPKLLVCLSPAQRPLVGETKADQLLDDHQKFVERRGYHELSSAQVRALDNEQQEQQQQQKQSEMLKTAAMMRELRKSLTPTQEPPPVPVKSAETAAKASAKRDDASADPKRNGSSSSENKPRQAADPSEHTEKQQQQQQQTRSSHQMNSSTDVRFPATTTIGGMESELAKMFPSMAQQQQQQQGDIFEEQRKRFSNIETTSSSQPKVQHHTKRYSNIETSSYESKKRTENGQVIYDITNSSHERQSNRFPQAEAEAELLSFENGSPGPGDASLELYDRESYYRSRSLSPQSQVSACSSSYLQRVYTGEVQKMRQHFEGIHRESNEQSNDFFGLSPLRKARSDPEFSAGSKDASGNATEAKPQKEPQQDQQQDAHKFELRRATPSPERGRRRQRSAQDRLMPHIDVISKTAALKRELAPRSALRSLSSSSSNYIERLRMRYESPDPADSQTRTISHLSTSHPDLRDVHDISPHLCADWVAHKHPQPIDQPRPKLPKALPKKPQRVTPRASSASPPRPHRSPRHQHSRQQTSSLRSNYDDIFANQKFDPRMHRPKARYVPDGAEQARRSPASGGGTTTLERLKKTMAVTFKDPDSNAPPIPPQPPIKGLYSSSYDLQYNTDTIDGSESPNRYYDTDVNIHFKTPIRHEQKQYIPEEELATRQAEHMQKLYHEERRRKYLQELQDMNSRRHTDNFTPSQKSPIALNRYDDFPTDVTLKSLVGPKTVARALYNFQGQSSKELSFRKGDTIYIRRQIDPNWYEGEHNAMIGLLPASYVEIVSRDGARTPSKRPSEGQARAKYNFQAQSGVELSLNKGELVTLTRRVDGNWFEGKIANRKGIFPVSYVEVLTDIGAEDIAARTTTVISSQSTTNLRPNLDVLRTNINNEFNTLTQNGAQPVNGILKETRTLHKTDALHVDTSSEPLAYRALYKYRPQNSDELELLEGDLVHVLEKCDDGWFVGTSQRTGCFGTFPGNYVERA
ncbi:uncharacterized protein LOC117592457 isoform X23 [Drosophila guanche]|uniref:uncharacterized protein LOC117592457 isoform X23 n=1 Tax=Drosophila guanche TaxID=7266 RepID=UPI00147218BC|nr:uncharacterized protein LOC117592457 isoform X23 [Drosophila guanche]